MSQSIHNQTDSLEQKILRDFHFHPPTINEEVHGEFIGMIKLSDHGTEIFKHHFHRLKKIYWKFLAQFLIKLKLFL